MFKAPLCSKWVQYSNNTNTKSLIVFIIVLFCVCLNGCASSQLKTDRGRASNILPSWQKVKHSAKNALVRKDTWVPALGAVAVQLGGVDQKISDWAGSSTPVFGSNIGARNASDRMRDANKAIFYGTLLLGTDGQNIEERSSNFLYELGVEQSSIALMDSSTGFLKTNVGRERPNGSNGRSFPSHHAASAMAHGTLAKRNMTSWDLGPESRFAINGLVNGLSVATAWARVEGLAHYPGDVMAGAALANFTSHFMYNLFFDSKKSGNIVISPVPGEKGGKIEVQVPF